MNAIEIVTRETPQFYSEEEMCYVVEQYVKEKKGADINIDLSCGFDPHSLAFEMIYRIQLKKLFAAFEVAAKYFAQK